MKEILEIRKGSVVLIVTMPTGTQYTNNQVVAAMQEFGEKVKMADVTSQSTAVSKKLTAGGLTGKLFPPTVEIRLKGEGGRTRMRRSGNPPACRSCQHAPRNSCASQLPD